MTIQAGPELGRTRRHLQTELVEGATDGAVKKAAPNWSNRTSDATDAARHVLSHVEGGYDWSPEDGPKHLYVHGYVS
jgi:hypothetical protein